MEELIYYGGMLLLGVGVGLLSGALGLGGGILMVPAFLTFVPGMDPHTAKGTSLFIIIFVALLNAWRLTRDWEERPWALAAILSVGSIAGGYFGAWITTLMARHTVVWIFIALVLLLAVRTFFLQPKELRTHATHRRRAMAVGIGGVTGVASGATGTGGGAVLIPLALWSGIVSNARVVGLSNMVMVATSIAGSVAHMRAVPVYDAPYVVGHVALGLVPLVFVGAQIGSPYGKRFNAMLTLPRRRMLMGVLLFVIAARLLYEVLR